MSKKEYTYKSAMNELQEIVLKLESDAVEVDELSSLVKKATELVNFCKEKLRKTEEELNETLKN